MGINGSGASDTDGDTVFCGNSGLCHCVQSRHSHIFGNLFPGTASECFSLGNSYNFVAFIHNTGFDARAAQINADAITLFFKTREHGNGIAADGIAAAVCADEDAVAFFRLNTGSALLYLSFSRKEQERVERGAVRFKGCFSIDFQTVNREVFALSQMCAEVIVAFCRAQRSDFAGFFHMKLSRLAVCAGSAVVINAVGNIAGLLNFCNYKACTDGVNGTGFNEENVTGFDINTMQFITQRVVLDGLAEFLCGNFMLKAVVKPCTGLSFHHIPHFCFSVLIFMCLCISIIGMNLNRQILCGINQLNQNGEFFKTSGSIAQSFRMLCQIVCQRFAVIFAAGNHARAIRMTAQLPCFGKNIAVIILSVGGL